MTDADQSRPTRRNLAAFGLLVVIVLAGALLFLRFERALESVRCLTLDGDPARVDCLRRLIEERSSHHI